MRSGCGSRSIRVLAIAVLGLAGTAAGRADAQFVSYGSGYGFGGYAPEYSVGMSLYDQEVLKQQAYAESVARYQLQTAQAVQAYEAANLLREQAVATALENQRQSQALTVQYDVRTKQTAPEKHSAGSTPRPPIPLGVLIDPQGKVLWPDGAPVGGDLATRRQQADAAIQAAYQQFRDQGRASVPSVVEAKRTLYAYGNPALARLRASSVLRSRVSTLLPFLQDLDAAVDSLGEATPPAG